MTREVRFRDMERYGFGPNVMKKTKICAKCGQISKKSAIICQSCKALLPRGTLYDRYRSQHPCCSKCGTVLANDAKYCPQCGKQINAECQKHTQGGKHEKKAF